MGTRLPDSLNPHITNFVAAILVATSGSAFANTEISVASNDVIENIYVYGEPGETDTATRLNLTLFETPQSVSAISRAQLEDFLLTSINDALDYSPGVTVEEIETDRSYYTARGFDVVNFQYDGVGTPFTFGINLGHQDSAIYEQVEVVKGAAGLITGLANPSATINYKRKRPTTDLNMATTLVLNDEGGYRVEGDISGSINSTIRGRVVAVNEDSDTYLDRHEEAGDLIYGIVEFDLTDNTLLTLGHSYNKSKSDGGLWGALPLVYSDGTPTDYSASTNTAADWTFSDVTRNQSFVEVQHYLAPTWSVNAMYTYNKMEHDSELFYVYGTPDRTTELGLFGYASGYDGEEDQGIFDFYVSGLFTLGNRDHELVVGYNRAEIDTVQGSYYDFVNGFPVLGSDWDNGDAPVPTFTDHDPFNDASDIEQTQESLYIASRLHLTDSVAVLLGARRAEVEQDGFSYGASSNTDAGETVPYLGATWNITEQVMVYGSYSEVFVQQTWVDDTFTPLGPTQGDNAELGIKTEFNDGRAILTAAVFEATHHNLGEFVSRDAATGTAFYAPRDFDSDGYEIEISGQLLDGVNLSAGYTHVEVEDQSGMEARPYIPENLVKVSASYDLAAISGLRVGGVVKWQDSITNTHAATGAEIEQDSYALVDLMARYTINPNLSVALNVGNITDEKFLNSIYWEQAYYGAPRNVQASITWRH